MEKKLGHFGHHGGVSVSGPARAGLAEGTGERKEAADEGQLAENAGPQAARCLHHRPKARSTRSAPAPSRCASSLKKGAPRGAGLPGRARRPPAKKPQHWRVDLVKAPPADRCASIYGASISSATCSAVFGGFVSPKMSRVGGSAGPRRACDIAAPPYHHAIRCPRPDFLRLGQRGDAAVDGKGADAEGTVSSRAPAANRVAGYRGFPWADPLEPGLARMDGERVTPGRGDVSRKRGTRLGRDLLNDPDAGI